MNMNMMADKTFNNRVMKQMKNIEKSNNYV
jgi:hypothetical protein